MALSRDTTESDLKQRREIRDGTAHYVDQVCIKRDTVIVGYCDTDMLENSKLFTIISFFTLQKQFYLKCKNAFESKGDRLGEIWTSFVVLAWVGEKSVCIQREFLKACHQKLRLK